jgi:site-specific DNA recombinase
MKKPATATRRNRTVRCAIYTRKSSEEGLEQEFNSLQAQREACEAFIESQRQEGWICLRAAYDDGGFSGARMDRPALQRLLADLTAGRVDTIVVYKIDRLTRSLADFAPHHGHAPARARRLGRACERRAGQPRLSNR